MTSSGERQTIVVGLDGADFQLLDPWMADGELPALRRIVESGVSGDLESVCPPVTSPNWKAYATGKNPGKLGIFWWWNTDTERGETYRPSDRYNDHTEYWELIARDEPVGVLGVPTTYPPKSAGSFVVSGAPDADGEGFTHPPALEDELRERFDYRVTRDHLLREGREEAFEEVLDLIDTKFEAAKYLRDRFDVSFLQVTTFHVNLLHHAVWDHEYTLEAWKRIDDHLADWLDEGNNVVVMSDHGMAEIPTVFRINQWLRREGYLTYDAGASQTLYDLGVSSDQLKKLLDQVNDQVPTVDLRQLASDLAPQWALNQLPDADGELGASKHSQIDWERSEALAGQLGPVYLLVDRGTPRYEQLRAELRERLENLTDPHGRPVAEAVHRGEELYSGPYVEEGPDLVVEPARGVHIAEGIGPADVFSEEKDAWRAVNARYGVFAATGPDFATGTAADLSILDLAPTMLHLHDCPVPADMDGTVREDLFASDSDPDRRSPRYTESVERAAATATDAGGDMADRLRDLGYL